MALRQLGRGTALALGLALLPGSVPAEQPRAAGGVALVEALEAAPVAVVARVLEVEHLDGQAYHARLRVERALGADAGGETLLGIAWEELAPSRAPRFAKGERVLLALEPLPGYSIWRRRLPAPEAHRTTLTVARRGEAFLRRPSLGSVDRLAHFLALTPRDRDGPSGAGLLAELAARAEPPLAIGAVKRLGRLPDLDAALLPPAAESLVRALLRGDAALAAAILELVAARRPEPLRPPLEARVAAAPLAPAVVFEALARLEGGIEPELAARLLSEAPPAHRAAVARFASGPDSSRRLAGLVHDDPAAEVRSSAVRRLAEIDPQASLPVLLPVLGDTSPEVRQAAVEALGSLGAEAVPGLRAVAFEAGQPAAGAALLALTLTGSPEAATVLGEIAETHPDAGLRKLAGLALHRRLGERH